MPIFIDYFLLSFIKSLFNFLNALFGILFLFRLRQ